MHIGGVWSEEPPPVSERWEFCGGGLRLHYGRFATAVQDDRHFLVMDGQIYDASVPQALAEPVRLQTAYGLYCYVWYDKTSGEVNIGTDRFGYFPIYYAFENRRFIFGSSLGFVKNRLRQRTPDYEAWEELLTLGEVIGDKSTIKEIKRLGEGTRIQIRDGSVQFHRYWRPEVPDLVNESTYIRENNALLDEAMHLTRSQSRRKVVLLSGGEDSRRLALAAARQNFGVEFFTQESLYRGHYRRYVDRDVKLAARVAAVLERPHFIEPLPDEKQYLADWRVRDTALGFECIAHEWLLPLARRIAPEALIFDGIVGDITMNGHYFKEFPAAVDNYASADDLARMVVGKSPPRWFDEADRRTDTTVLQRVRDILSSYPESPHRLTFYFVFNHTRRKISWVAQLFGIYGHWTCYPYLYFPLFVQSLSIDPRLLVTKFYQRECMAALAPKVLSVPTTREEIPGRMVDPEG